MATELKLGDSKYRSQEKGQLLAPLDFAVKGVTADQVLTGADRQSLQSQLFERMKELQRVIDDIIPANADFDNTELIINELLRRRDRLADSSLLRHDLNNLLIASLVTSHGVAEKEGETSTGDWKTQIWSYRRLDNKGNDGYVENWGPTIVARPNDVLFIPILNLLYKSELQRKTVPNLKIPNGVVTGVDAKAFENAPHDFDITNLHTHGLNVSPEWPSDDVFRPIKPGQLKFFVYHIPPEHPTGTFFYHPHYHGSVATQVAGGMAGPLLVVSNKTELRGLDQAGQDLKWTDGEVAGHGKVVYPHVFMIQQLSLFQNLNAKKNELFSRPDFFAMKDMGPWTEDSDKNTHEEYVDHSERPQLANLARILHGVEPSYSVKKFDVTSWVNGKYQPKFPALNRGEIRRVRLIHAGVEDLVYLKVQYKVGDNQFKNVQFQVIARDGIPLPVPQRVGEIETDYAIEGDEGNLILAPGNRADILISLPKDISGITELEIASDNAKDSKRVPLAKIPVNGAVSQAAVGFLSKIQADAIQNAQVSGQFVNRPGLPAAPGMNAKFSLEFGDATSLPPDAHGISKFNPGTFTVNGGAFPKDQSTFRLNSTSDLSFDTVVDSGEHPFHIHVNPFLVAAAASDAEKTDRLANGLPVSSFWADTLLIREEMPFRVKMPFNNWTGRYVGHCHILDHEDAGMMSNLRIDPASNGVPRLPFPEVISLATVPSKALLHLYQVSPNAGGRVPESVPGTVTIFVFMPKLPEGACPHCAESVKAIANLRSKKRDINLRIVAITNGVGSALPSRESLGLAASDVLCTDYEMCAFEACGLIDGTPVRDRLQGYCFPSSFKNGTRHLKHDSDLMHGLFVVSPDGKVFSERRGFMAFDEDEQIMEEVKHAALPEAERGIQLKSLLESHDKGITKRLLLEKLQSTK